MDYDDKAYHKHPCPDCRFCQWCADTRCAVCLKEQGACCKSKPATESKQIKNRKKKKASSSRVRN